MLEILRAYVEGNYRITEFTTDGETVSSRVSELIVENEEPTTEFEPQPTPSIEQMQAKTLLNTELLLIYKELEMEGI